METMTPVMELDEFLEKAKAKGNWRIDDYGRIVSGYDSPLKAVFGQYEFVHIAQSLGLPIGTIIAASDNHQITQEEIELREIMEGWTMPLFAEVGL